MQDCAARCFLGSLLINPSSKWYRQRRECGVEAAWDVRYKTGNSSTILFRAWLIELELNRGKRLAYEALKSEEEGLGIATVSFQSLCD